MQMDSGHCKVRLRSRGSGPLSIPRCRAPTRALELRGVPSQALAAPGLHRRDPVGAGAVRVARGAGKGRHRAVKGPAAASWHRFTHCLAGRERNAVLQVPVAARRRHSARLYGTGNPPPPPPRQATPKHTGCIDCQHCTINGRGPARQAANSQALARKRPAGEAGPHADTAGRPLQTAPYKNDRGPARGRGPGAGPSGRSRRGHGKP